MSDSDAASFIDKAMSMGANFFDHADIYGGGRCEEKFASAFSMNDDKRESVILQSKCGIRPGRYDFDRDYILSSVDGILKRLKTDYLDVLLLHRPDILCEPEEVAEAFSVLKNSGKVRNFGVSNHNPMQIALLEKYLGMPIVANQIQMSITNCTAFSQGINVNMMSDSATMRDGSVVDYCRLNDITLQAWSPFQYGFFRGVFFAEPSYAPLTAALTEVGERYGISPSAAVMAWLLRLPEGVQPIVGTASPERLRDLARGASVRLTHEEWYRIYKAAGNQLP
jgi:predicted oxidoreductase